MRKPLLWYSVANTGLYAMVPPIVVGLLLPAGLLLAQASGSPQFQVTYVDFCIQLLVPAFAVWWPPFVFKERIEGDGRELLYFLKRSGEGATALALALAYGVLLVPFLLLALNTPDSSVTSVPLVLARCLFATSLVFCMGFVLRSSALALVVALLFNLTAMMPLESLAESLGPAAVFSGVPSSTILLYAVLSTALLWLGEVRGRHFTQ